jgi:predicted aldo/keto reductase-like oxidoreductase
MRELKDAGKVRCLGVSTHNARLVNDIAAEDDLDILMVQLNVTMADDTRYLADLERAAAAGKGIIVMKTQGGNRLAPGIMNHRAALKWALRHEWAAAAVPGYTSVAQLRENFGAALDLAYTPGEREFLARRGLTAAMGFCRLCRSCRGDCPRGVDVPALVRAHMYAVGYANPGLARATLAAVAPGAGPAACAGCAACVVRCRHGVDVAADLVRLRTTSIRY